MKFIFKSLLLVLSLCFNNCFSQTIEFVPLRCKGDIPKDFLELSSAKVKHEQDIINSRKLSKKEKATQTEFATNTNYGVDQILLSGLVLYGDPLTNYINKVADIVLKDNQDLRKQLRLYTLKSSTPNAFTTNQGIIFVTTGLMAQVENEAQLAFILCHEIIHFREHHSYQNFKKVKKISNKGNRYKPDELEEKLKKLYNYSKANELEADSKGLELFLKTDYSPKQAIATFDMLLYSYLPFEEAEWMPTYFEDSFYKFPSKLTLSEVKEISADAAEDDKNLTHPNIQNRKNALISLLDTNNSKPTTFLTEKGEFEIFQHIARIEISFLYIFNAAYERAFYHAILLEKNYKDYVFANRIKSMALYGTYKHKLAEDNFEFANFANCEGESQRLYYFFNEIKARDMTVLASREIWNAYLLDKNDDFLKTLAYESLSDVFRKAKMNLSSFAKSVEKEAEQKITDPEKKESKVEKIKKRSKKIANILSDSINYSSQYLSNAYIELYNNSEFTRAIKSLAFFKDETPPDVEQVIERKKRNNTAFNFDTLLMLNPSYTGPVDKKGKKNKLKEERKEISLATTFTTMASKNNIKLSMLNTLDKENLNTEAWNNYMILNQWLIERLNNDTITMSLFSKEFVTAVRKNYNTNYLGISGFRYFGGSGLNFRNNDGEGLSSIGEPNLYYFMIIFNTKTSRIEFIDYQEFVSKMRAELVSGVVYDTFYHLKKKQKK